MTRSFYLGPDRRNLPLSTWADVHSAAAAGVLDETHWVELKEAVPPSSKDANRELGRDLASLSVDGGLLVIGIEDDGGKAGAVVGTRLDGLVTRIDQVARGVITPPLNVSITTVAHPDDDELGVLVVQVPASVTAPHMVDGRYWGRSSTGKDRLSDPAVRRLIRDRDARQAGFEDRLAAVRDELDLEPTERKASHLYLLLEPKAVPMAVTLHDQLGEPRRAQAALLNTLSHRPVYPPSFEGLSSARAHPDGYLLSSVLDGAPVGDLMIQVLLGDDGSVRLVSGRASYAHSIDRWFVTANHVIDLTHHTVRAAASIAQEHLGFHGQWRLGVVVDQMKGLKASQAVEHGGWNVPAFPTDECRQVITASSEEMLENTAVVVAGLLSRFLRGLGVERLGRYRDISEVTSQR